MIVMTPPGKQGLMRDILAIILAGGKGERLHPLTEHRAKPAVPFGGKYRIIDFTLSNCINSDIRKIVVVIQYKSLSLERHITLGWGNLFSPELDEFMISIPPQQRIDERWYLGTADAVYQNIYFIEKEEPPYLLILSGDHIYKMDYSEMLAFHIERGALGTVAAIEIDKKEASAFGIMEVDGEWRITGFEEKPRAPKTMPGNPDQSLASMGVYIFNTEAVIERLKRDASKISAHDFGRDILPDMLGTGKMYAYNFKDENKPKVLVAWTKTVSGQGWRV